MGRGWRAAESRLAGCIISFNTTLPAPANSISLIRSVLCVHQVKEICSFGPAQRSISCSCSITLAFVLPAAGGDERMSMRVRRTRAHGLRICQRNFFFIRPLHILSQSRHKIQMISSLAGKTRLTIDCGVRKLDDITWS